MDLVARDPAGILVAVEVRARRSARTGAAVTTVDRRRVTRLGRTLAAYASDESIAHRGLRVDLVTVEPDAATGDLWLLRRTPGVE